MHINHIAMKITNSRDFPFFKYCNPLNQVVILTIIRSLYIEKQYLQYGITVYIL